MPAGPASDAHHSQPDRARVAKVVRPVGRSTFTTRARPGRTVFARRDATTKDMQLARNE
jgi:hypothetical protein